MVRCRVVINAIEIRGECPVYKMGDEIIIEGFYIKSGESANVCMHAFSAMQTLLSAFMHGSSAKDLGIGTEKDIGYLRCPDPGSPYTLGGTVTFRLKREVVEE